MNTGRAIFAALALAVIPIVASAQDFDKGLSAYESGDFETAVQEWRPLAEQGYASAQYNLGFMYAEGLGVPEDDAEAVRWFSPRSAKIEARSPQYTRRPGLSESGVTAIETVCFDIVNNRSDTLRAGLLS